MGAISDIAAISLQAFYVKWGVHLIQKGMGKLAPNRRRVGVVIDEQLVSFIEKRAKMLGLAPSRFTAMIVERWADDGAAPVSEPDRLVQIAAQSGNLRYVPSAMWSKGEINLDQVEFASPAEKQVAEKRIRAGEVMRIKSPIHGRFIRVVLSPDAGPNPGKKAG